MKQYLVVEITNGIVTVNGKDTNLLSEVPVILSGFYITGVISNHDIPIDDGGLVVFTIPANSVVGNSGDWDQVRAPGPLSVEPPPTANGRFTVIVEPITLRIDK